MSAAKKKKAGTKYKNKSKKSVDSQCKKVVSKPSEETKVKKEENTRVLEKNEKSDIETKKENKEIFENSNNLENSFEANITVNEEKKVDESENKEKSINNMEIEILEESKSIKEIEKSELATISSKEVKKIDEKPEYIKAIIKREKVIKKTAILIILLILFFIIISTIFAILNVNKKNIISGVEIKSINISGLSKEESITRLEEAIKKELIAEINFKYGENYNVSLKPEQIEFKYNIQEAVNEAYSVGRKGNILIDNYSIIFTKLFGKNINIEYSYNQELLNQFVEDINSKIPGAVVEPAYYIENNQLIINKGIDGIQVKSEELKNQIVRAIIERNALVMAYDFSQTIEIPAENVKASAIEMDKIYAEIHTEPQDAYYETEPYKIYPDVDGVDLSISLEEAKNIIKSENKDEYIFDLKITEAQKKLDDLGTEAFPHLISQYSTKYDAKNKNRSTNLEIAARKINGKVLMPGDEFSFNTIVGKRTVEEGYKDAKIYADGGVVDGLAGGICQISSTLYNAVLLSNLDITERRNHSFTTSYAPAGRDATVVWGRTDFKFVNSRTYPIKIDASVKNGIAEFKIYGMKEDTEYEVNILPVRTQSIPYTTIYQEDASILPGQQLIKQSGHSGCKVTTYKELKLNGEIVSKEVISNDTYQPMRTIVGVAPGQIPVIQ